MDIHTLHLEHVVLLALCTVITIANASLYRGVKGIHWFSLYNLSALLGAIAVSLRAHIPDFLSIVIGNLLVITAYFFFSLSLTAFFGTKTTHYYLQGSMVVIGVVTMLQFGWLHQDTPRRLIAYSLVLGCQQTQIAFFLTRQRSPSLRVATTSMSLILTCLALANFVRIVGVGALGAPSNYLNAGPFLGWIVIVNSCLQCGVIVSYVWMTAAHLRQDLEIQASTDPLTGLLNRRAIEVAAEQHIYTCNRSGAYISAIILDLDDFKQINDTHGHHCGDVVLITVANRLQNSLRRHDLLARVGGDEFAILLPNTPLATASGIAAELQSSIAQSKITYGQIGTTVTISFGLAQLQPPNYTWEQLVMCCDKALYEAKRSRSTLPPPRPLQNPSLNFADAELS